MRQMKFGIELEVATKKSRETIVEALQEHGIDAVGSTYGSAVNHSQWKVQYDGSLPNGWEIVSPPLTSTDELEKVVYVLRNVLKVRCNKNTGLHIHHDVSDLTIDQLKRVFQLYNKYEGNAIRSIIRKHRLNNAYCKSIGYLTERINRMSSLEEFRNSINGRYFTLNPSSYVKYGTIEFRQHYGTAYIDEVLGWLEVTGKIIEAAVNNEELEQTIKSTNNEDALEELFEEIDLSDSTRKMYRRVQRVFAKLDGEAS